jgi:hypothetical protein
MHGWEAALAVATIDWLTALTLSQHGEERLADHMLITTRRDAALTLPIFP